MAFIAISRAARGALTVRLKRVLRVLAERVDLRTEAQTLSGEEPPIWLDPQGGEWSVYCDPRITVDDVAFAAAALKGSAKLPDPDETVEGELRAKDRAKVRAEARAAISYVNPPAPEGVDPYTYAIQANAGPPIFKAFSGPPPTWSPKDAA